MHKRKYLGMLRKQLKKLPPVEIENAVQYYSEIIDELLDEGRDWDEILLQIGYPDEAASNILEQAAPDAKGRKSRSGDEDYGYAGENRNGQYDPGRGYGGQGNYNPNAGGYNPNPGAGYGGYGRNGYGGGQGNYNPNAGGYNNNPYGQNTNYGAPEGKYYDPMTGTYRDIPKNSNYNTENSYYDPVRGSYRPTPEAQRAYAEQENRDGNAAENGAKEKKGGLWKALRIMMMIIAVPVLFGLAVAAFALIVCGGAFVVAAPLVFIGGIIVSVMSGSFMMSLVCLAAALAIGGIGCLLVFVTKITWSPAKNLFKSAVKRVKAGA